MTIWDNKYKTILADPPWDYTEIGFHGYKGVKPYDIDSGTQYETMTMYDIIKLPVKDIADDYSHLYLWVPQHFVEDGFVVLEAWGFKFKNLLTWVKKPRLGLGYYFRNCTEFIMFGVRGNLRTLNRSEPNYFEAPISRHSRKPEVAYEIIERNSYSPMVELFARKPRPGWDSWGNEL